MTGSMVLDRLSKDLIKSVADWIEGLAKADSAIDATRIHAKLSHLADAVQSRDQDSKEILELVDAIKNKKKLSSVDAMNVVDTLSGLK